MASHDQSTGPITWSETRLSLLYVGRLCIAAAGTLVAISMLFHLGGGLVFAAFVLTAIGAPAITYLATRRAEALFGAAIVTLLSAPVALVIAGLSMDPEPLALMGAGKWVYRRRRHRDDVPERALASR